MIIIKEVNMFIFDPDKTYRMPPFFGGSDYNKNLEIKSLDAIAMMFTYKTDEKKLADYLPEGFELLKPELSINFYQLKGCEFLIGGGYNIIQVAVPARFHGKQDYFEGTFPLVIWENCAQCIVGGREENGQPKLFADIQDMHIYHNSYFTNASYDGNTFLRLEMTDPQAVDMQTFEQIKSTAEYSICFGWRYIPKIGAPGADLSQPVIYPQGFYPNGAWYGKGNFEWTKLDSKYNFIDVPNNQYQIIKQLADLPVYEVMPAIMLSGVSIMRPYNGRVIE
jgi:Acetoacetate decarboxylase